MTPRAGRAARAVLRAKGQFWTPVWVADAMVAYCLGDDARSLFDPAVGAGAFFVAAKKLTARTRTRVRLTGCEVDPAALAQARANGLTSLRGVAIGDFTTDRLSGAPYDAIVANPPYVRHHRLSVPHKAKLRALSMRVLGTPLDGRAGLHVYFLLRALDVLAPNGRLAFIVPADTVEGVFAPALWSWIADKFRINAVVTFGREATPFPGVDTNAVIVMISRDPPQPAFAWAHCTSTDGALARFVRSQFRARPGVSVRRRELSEALRTGLSRPPRALASGGPVLGDFAKVRRGIATGANDFFFLTTAAAKAAGLPRSVLIPAVGRVRDVPESVLTASRLQTIAASGRPTLLFSPGGAPMVSLPPAVRAYLRRGERLGLPKRALIATRSPWYKTESRAVPPFLFAYLGRRNARFIRNDAGVVPLTGFLCVYPRSDDPRERARLWRVLCHADTVANLGLVGKSYGSGAIKVEPRALERLPLSAAALASAGLAAPALRSRAP